ncbi:hypothetical protein PHLGIDRAFT_16913 [Phlebiopsis gigantea 11061_1 CR5-6]|uniref:Uncharacterized protein n=1 Tax=Phlebiopsis gigantea (strain 11061_1 CR5-6) TaxID=745531 RepID=A0A0C3PAP7_PHLG1|nr:hypothetical protein PHLGIDRAFT_16913 [Phlebiopsis gigantea 11061_1 CR5-6]
MQRPTCTHTRVRNVHDAQVILHAVSQGYLPMVRRRLDDDERQALAPGDIYVWEERGNNPLEAPSLESIQRFTDGRSWGPSKARDEFLMYYEKDVNSRSSLMTRNSGLQAMRLIKQTYSAYVDGPAHARKWHLNAYYTQDTVDAFGTIDDDDTLRALHAQAQHPHGKPAPRYAEVRVTAFQLAPLEYLESIPPGSRDPCDERVLRSFQQERPF